MVLHSVPVVALASISGLVGILFLYIHFRYPKDHPGGSFALVCFAIVLYDIGCIGLYNSNSFITSAEWQRFQFMTIALLTIALGYFYHKVTGALSNRALIIIAIINVGFILTGYTIKNHLTLSPEHTAAKIIEMGDMVNVQYLEAQPGIIYNAQVILSLGVYTICLIGLAKHRRGMGKKGGTIAAGLIIFYCAAVNDALVGMGLLKTPYLFEYAFSALIVSMAAIQISDFLNLHGEIENLNLTLEKTVKQRTDELQTLSGLLPICSSCKNIRDDSGYWERIESYVSKHSGAEFSHGLCPECAKKLYPEFYLSESIILK